MKKKKKNPMKNEILGTRYTARISELKQLFIIPLMPGGNKKVKNT